jgi:hypothetical protein
VSRWPLRAPPILLAAAFAAAGHAQPGSPAAAEAAAPPPAAAASAPEGPASAATTDRGPPAFQGLHWGDGEAAIERRFGARLERPACDAASRRQSAALGEACDMPTIPRYEVAGIAFTLRLHLALADRALVRVTLEHSAEPEGGRIDDSRWSSHHRTLRRLLTQRYGSPEATELNNEPGHPTAYARWRPGPTLIELSSGASARSGAQPAREWVRLQYQPLHGGEAGKL